MDASSIKYGAGATREIGHDLGQWGARRVMVVTGPNPAGTEPGSLMLDALREAGIDAVPFDQVEVEPTDRPFQVAIAFAVAGRFDGFVAVVGGSSIDTAKAANPHAT
jgi:hydroxyacid-oxoacid transhydrogenase